MIPGRPAATAAEGARLTRFQRILVGTDGTVSHLLEAYAGEPVEVLKLVQAFDTCDEGDADLHLSADGKVLRREVLIRGAASGRTLLHAQAVVVLDRVDPGLVDDLLATDTPLGLLLAQRRTETFREVLHVGRQPAGTVATHFGIDAADEVVARTYRIVSGGQPVALVKERFPADCFLELTG